jgi:hypothetical protein
MFTGPALPKSGKAEKEKQNEACSFLPNSGTAGF